MINRRTIFDIHRLAQQGFSVRKIANALGISRQTVQKYLDDPNPERPTFTRPSKLDPFKDDIRRMLAYVRDTCKNRSQRVYAAWAKSDFGCNGSG